MYIYGIFVEIIHILKRAKADCISFLFYILLSVFANFFLRYVFVFLFEFICVNRSWLAGWSESGASAAEIWAESMAESVEWWLTRYCHGGTSFFWKVSPLFLYKVGYSNDNKNRKIFYFLTINRYFSFFKNTKLFFSVLISKICNLCPKTCIFHTFIIGVPDRVSSKRSKSKNIFSKKLYQKKLIPYHKQVY